MDRESCKIKRFITISIFSMRRFIWSWSKKLMTFDLRRLIEFIFLRPSTSFVAPQMIVERHKRDVRERHKKSHHQTQCHYQGKIRGHDNSKVALSACNGLVRAAKSSHIKFHFALSASVLNNLSAINSQRALLIMQSHEPSKSAVFAYHFDSTNVWRFGQLKYDCDTFSHKERGRAIRD